MTQHLHSKRLPRLRPGSGKVLAAVIGLVAALSLGAVGQAKAGGTVQTAASADRFSDQPHGFASLAGGTTGGAGGRVVTVADQASPAKYAAAEDPYIIRVSGSIAVEPFGSNIVVGSNKTIMGPAAIRSSPWTDMSGFSWKGARFAEYRNHGPGAGVTADRPQMSDAEAKNRTVADHLKGNDNWAPYARH